MRYNRARDDVYDDSTTSGLTITGLAELLDRCGRIDEDSYEWVWVYVLRDEHGRGWYVGSSKNPTLRLAAHLKGQCKDTAPTIRAMRERGAQPTMQLLDVTLAADRIPVEGWWISQHPSAVNTSRYHDHAKQFARCPTCYRSASAGTLAAAT